MAQNSWPFDNAPTTETQYSRLFRELQSDGVCPSTTTPSGELGVSVAGSLTISVDIGNAFIRGFMYENTAAQSVSVASVSSGSIRYDTVVLRMDPNANTVTIVVIQGNNTTAPSPVQTWPTSSSGVWDFPLANISVATSGVVTITNDLRRFCGKTSGRWSTLTRPTTPVPGHPGYNTTTGFMEWWDGIQWQNVPKVVSDTGWQSITYGGGGNGSGWTFGGSTASTQGGYLKLRKIANAVYLDLFVASPGSSSVANVNCNLPGAYIPANFMPAAAGSEPWVAAQPLGLFSTYNTSGTSGQAIPSLWSFSVRRAEGLWRADLIAGNGYYGNSSNPFRLTGFLWVTD